MLKKRIAFFAFLCLTFSVLQLKSHAQNAAFSADTSKFIEEITEQFQKVGDADAAEARQVLSEFTELWTSNKIPNAQKKQVKAICFALNEQKLQVAPYYVLYFKIITSLAKQNSAPGTFDLFHKSVNYCLKAKSPTRTTLRYLTQTELLISSNAFMRTGTEAWYIRGGKYKFAFDSVPNFVFTAGSLACVVKNDSACIYDTKGSFYPLSQTWVGKGGKVYWERAGLGRDVVYAKLFGYKIDTRSVSYSADSVSLYHGGYFKKFLTGKLEDKASMDASPENTTFPRFTMQKGTQVYINLFKNIEFFGGFNLQGSRVIGSAAADGFARIEIKHNNKPFITFRSSEFVIRPDRFVSANAAAVILLENDSIFHPSLNVRYNLSVNELIMSRGDEGLSQSPFFDTYHRLDMYTEAIYWKLNENVMSFEDIKGIRTKSESLFESSDYYSLNRFDKLQGIDDVNPVVLVSAYARRRNTDRFYVEDFAANIKKPVEQVRTQLVKLANSGFIIYDIENGFAVVQPRLNEYLAAHSGVKDSDIIQFHSNVEKGSNALLDLKTMRLSIEGVKQVMLSDSQYVYVVPRDEKVTVLKNRDFVFKGRVHAGLFDFMANECTFRYDKFSLSMPKIDSALMLVPAWTVDGNGNRPFVRVKNVLSNMNGELFIDSTESKSGRKMLHHYPLLISKDTSYVYFDKKNVVNGIYKRNNFYFEINPFTMDSINSLPPGRLQFEGTLVSAGIFPKLQETISVQKDYSLGFKRVIPQPGLPVYGGKGTYSDTLRLSNSGLHGSGQLSYLSTVTESADFLFAPDSTTAKVKKFELAKVEGEVEFPDANVKDAIVKWTPGNDLMTVQNSKGDSISMFNNSAKLIGTLSVSPQGLRGKGKFSFENAEVTSDHYSFKTTSFTSDTSDFRLLTDDRNKDALRVHVFKTSIDFGTRQGHFIATGDGALMEFPFIQFNCVVNEFDWLMDKKKLQLINKTSFSRERYYQMKPDELLAFDPGREIYFSTDPKMDSLSFFALKGLYDLDSNFLEVEDARIIKVADAAIFPFNGKLSVGKNGKIKELKQAEIFANRTSLFHKFYNANVNIGSRKRYAANGLFDYTPSDGEITTIEMNNIAVNNKGETFAGAVISDSMNFMLNRYFKFKGKMEVNASTQKVYFEGGYGFVHDCALIGNEWIKLRASLDPKNIMIPVTDDPENTGNGNLRTSIYYSTTENTVMPGFFAKADNVTDPDIIKANGSVLYYPQLTEFRIADSAKLLDPTRPGNILRFNTLRCILTGEGQLQLSNNLGRVQMKSAGEINYYSIVDSTSLNIMSSLDFLFSEEVLKLFADALNASEAKGLDVADNNYTRSLREFVGQNEANNILSELGLYGQYRKFPEILDHTIVLAGLQMSWNKDLRSYISKGLVGISNLGKFPVNKLVKGYVEIGKRRAGDIINLYFEPSENQWYFFTYSNGTMQVISSNKTFNEKLTAIKAADRTQKGEKGQPSFLYIVGTKEKKNTFLRKMKQAEGGEE